MKILYLAPLVPAPSGSGGKRAIYNHLEDMLGEAVLIDAVFVDVDGQEGDPLAPFAAMTPRVFARAIPTFGSGLKGKVLAVASMLASKLPRSLAVVASPQVRELVRQAMAKQGYDAVIVDHLNAYGMLSGLRLSIPVIYVAHNVESEILQHGLDKMPRFSPWRIFARLDLARMRRVERAVLALARRVILIGAGDAAHPDMVEVREKLAVWPELPAPKAMRWSNSGGKDLLFVGSARYFPNKDAIDWLVTSLVPALLRIDATIMLHIVGSDATELGYDSNPAGVTFHGFVSNERLDAFHVQSNLFICPVVLGSGIKIKLLEAASYGLPAAATNESLAGIDFLSNIALRLDRDRPDEAARAISALLADPRQLVAMSNACTIALDQQIAARITLVDHVRQALAAA